MFEISFDTVYWVSSRDFEHSRIWLILSRQIVLEHSIWGQLRTTEKLRTIFLLRKRFCYVSLTHTNHDLIFTVDDEIVLEHSIWFLLRTNFFVTQTFLLRKFDT